jgi:hypothetical protein
MSGIVYILTNEAMEGLIKIGKTNTSVEQRIKELDNTSLPLPFQCFYAGEVHGANLVEKLLHNAFSDKRIRNNREFFRLDPDQARSAILIAQPKDVTPQTDVVVDASDVQALQKASAAQDRRSRLKFSELNIPIGSTLRFTKDENVSCTIVANGEVDFNGQILSPSRAALIAIHNQGYNWVTVSGSDFWKYEGETLTARRLRMEDEQI